MRHTPPRRTLTPGGCKVDTSGEARIHTQIARSENTTNAGLVEEVASLGGSRSDGSGWVIGAGIFAGALLLGAVLVGQGATLIVSTRGRAIRYTVTTVRTFSRAAFARWAPALSDGGGAARLVLVTCTGLDGSRYLSNVVVVARPSTVRDRSVG